MLSNNTVNAYATNARAATNAQLAELGLSRQQYKKMSKANRIAALRGLSNYVLVPSQPVEPLSVLNTYTPPEGLMNYTSGKVIWPGNSSLGPGTSRSVLFSSKRKNRRTRKGRKNRRNTRRNRRN